MSRFEIDRRTFLFGAGAATVVMLAGVNVVTDRRNDQTMREYALKVEPELEGIELKNYGHFRTRNGTDNLWFNYTNLWFHEGRAKMLLNSLESLASNQIKLPYLIYDYNNPTVSNHAVELRSLNHP